jgi:hypothetical protein
MAVTTFEGIGKVGGRSFARRLLDRYMDAQMKKARLRVNAYLQTMDDSALDRLGYTPAEIGDIRASDSTAGVII